MIIVHDEHAPKAVYNLHAGRNLIGRKAATSSTDIAIDTPDLCMSRIHCVIDVAKNARTGAWDFTVADANSANGTFLTGATNQRLSPEDVYFLSDGDAIQLGMTTVVFRRTERGAQREQIAHDVFNSERPKTRLMS